MNNCSYFIKNKAMFGSYPTQEAVYELELEGVRHFIDLTYSNENKIKPYKTTYKYLNYPILDRNIPTDLKSYSIFIIEICSIIKKLKDKELLYVHCRGGHGRSGIIVASILCYIFNMSPYDSLIYTTKCHSNRSVMRDKWRKIGSPQTYYQKKFVYKMFQAFNFNKIYKPLAQQKHCNYLSYTVEVPEYKIFENIMDAFNELYELYKENDKHAVFTKIKICKNNVKDAIMEYLICLKIEQHEIIRINLLNTYLRPIIATIENDEYWGVGKIGDGDNKYGKIMTNIKYKYLYSEKN